MGVGFRLDAIHRSRHCKVMSRRVLILISSGLMLLLLRSFLFCSTEAPPKIASVRVQNELFIGLAVSELDVAAKKMGYVYAGNPRPGVRRFESISNPVCWVNIDIGGSQQVRRISGIVKSIQIGPTICLRRGAILSDVSQLLEGKHLKFELRHGSTPILELRDYGLKLQFGNLDGNSALGLQWLELGH